MTRDAPPEAPPSPPCAGDPSSGSPPHGRRRALAGAAALLAAPWVAVRPARADDAAAVHPTDPSDPAGAWDGPVPPDEARMAAPPPPRHDFPRRPPRRVRVDIAAAQAEAFEWDGRGPVLRSRAVVGAPRTPTPRMTRPSPSVRVNPPWHVPDSIAPKIRRSEANGYRRTASGRLVLPPGPDNPLGPVRIGLADSDAIFLHGTNAPGLFARADRALSHGCVRLERAVEVAAWVAGVPPAALRAAIATGRTFELPVPDEVLVTLA